MSMAANELGVVRNEWTMARRKAAMRDLLTEMAPIMGRRVTLRIMMWSLLNVIDKM